MEARSYSVNELMSLRDSRASEASRGLPATVKEDPEFGEVLSKPEGESRAAKKQKEVSSSNDSEVTQRVNRGRRATQLSEGLEWRYSGRTASEMPSKEPLRAPTGLDKQGREGFQKFFKAVVSPTHVRVTAGGRIVPNTRGSGSPTTKRDKEQSANDVEPLVEPSKEEKSEPAYVHINNQASVPAAPMMHSNPPVTMTFQHMGVPLPVHCQPVFGPIQNAQPGPFNPITIGYNPITMAPMGPNGPYIIRSGPQPQAHEQGGDETKRFGGENQTANDTTRLASMRLSHPDQFDQGKPYYFNGRLIVPGTAMCPPQTASVVPMIGNPCIPTGVMAAQQYPGQGIATSNKVPGSMAFGGPNNRPSASGLAPQPAVMQMGYTPEVMPPVSSIRPSEITSKQLAQLRSSLKHDENQLELNVHQIDQAEVWRRCEKLRAMIEQFERTLMMQLEYEREHYPALQQTAQQAASHPYQMNGPDRRISARHVPDSEGSVHGSNISSMSNRHKYLKPNLNQQYHAGAGNRLGYRPNHTAGAYEAGLAREMANMSVGRQNQTYDNRNLVGRQTSSDRSSSRGRITQQGPTVLVQTPASWNQPAQGRVGQAMPSGAPFLGANTQYSAGLSGNGAAIPQFVGNLPAGINAGTFQGPTHVYGRELTEAEKQARSLYWGQLNNFQPAKAQVNNCGVNGTRPERSETIFAPDLRRPDFDPFRTSHDGGSIRSIETGRRLSKAIPIVAPPGKEKEPPFKEGGETGHDDTPVQDECADKQTELKSSSQLSRRVGERSSMKSGHELWQTMLKKGSPSGNVLPSAVTSTTATGYLPQFAGDAIASLGPTISNGSPARTSARVDSKAADHEAPRLATDKTGENCPPSSVASEEEEAKRELLEHMRRDAQRRGVIGSDWQ